MAADSLGPRSIMKRTDTPNSPTFGLYLTVRVTAIVWTRVSTQPVSRLRQEARLIRKRPDILCMSRPVGL